MKLIQKMKFIDENNCFKFLTDEFNLKDVIFYDLMEMPKNEWTQILLKLKIKNKLLRANTSTNKNMNKSYSRSKTRKITYRPSKKFLRQKTYLIKSNQF